MDANRKPIKAYLSVQLIRRMKHDAVDKDESLSHLIEEVLWSYYAMIDKNNQSGANTIGQRIQQKIDDNGVSFKDLKR